MLGELPVAGETDLVSARQTAHAVADLLGFDRQDQARIAAAVSEIARHALSHGGGRVAFSTEHGKGGDQLLVRIADSGHGFADLQDLLDGRSLPSDGRRTGLDAARRLMDRFDIESGPGGTSVLMGRECSGRRFGVTGIEAARAHLRRHEAADLLAALRDQNRELLQSLARLREREEEASRLNRELEDTNRGVLALYAELDQRAEQLRLASELKSRFLSHMSHEFRTPLNSILALSRMLLDGTDGPLGAEQERQVGYIRRSAGDLLELVNDLLDLAKVEAGKTEVRVAAFTVASLFGALRGSLRPLQSKPAVELTFEDAAGLPEVVSDEGKVAQILRNLVSNALKFTPQGEVRVSARFDSFGDRVEFRVRDSGIGIAPDDIERIFDEFSQIEGPHQQYVKGTGLGLSLSSGLAEILGGRIEVESEVGRGSTFTLRIPRHYRAAGQDPRLPCRILIVDDDESMRYLLRQFLRLDGVEVLEAVDGLEGVQRIERDRPQAVVLDLQMPGLDGFGVVEAVRSLSAETRPVIVVLTSMAVSPEIRRRLPGVTTILQKNELTREALHGALSLRSPVAVERDRA